MVGAGRSEHQISKYLPSLTRALSRRVRSFSPDEAEDFPMVTLEMIPAVNNKPFPTTDMVGPLFYHTAFVSEVLGSSEKLLENGTLSLNAIMRAARIMTLASGIQCLLDDLKGGHNVTFDPCQAARRHPQKRHKVKDIPSSREFERS